MITKNYFWLYLLLLCSTIELTTPPLVLLNRWKVGDEFDIKSHQDFFICVFGQSMSIVWDALEIFTLFSREQNSPEGF